MNIIHLIKEKNIEQIKELITKVKPNEFDSKFFVMDEYSNSILKNILEIKDIKKRKKILELLFQSGIYENTNLLTVDNLYFLNRVSFFHEFDDKVTEEIVKNKGNYYKIVESYKEIETNIHNSNIIELIEKKLKEYPNLLLFRNIDGNNLLTLATKYSNKKLIEYLLSKGMHIDMVGENLMTPLFIAAKNHDIELVQFFINKNANYHLKVYNKTFLEFLLPEYENFVLNLIKNKKINIDINNKNIKNINNNNNKEEKISLLEMLKISIENNAKLIFSHYLLNYNEEVKKIINKEINNKTLIQYSLKNKDFIPLLLKSGATLKAVDKFYIEEIHFIGQNRYLIDEFLKFKLESLSGKIVNEYSTYAPEKITYAIINGILENKFPIAKEYIKKVFENEEYLKVLNEYKFDNNLITRIIIDLSLIDFKKENLKKFIKILNLNNKTLKNKIKINYFYILKNYILTDIKNKDILFPFIKKSITNQEIENIKKEIMKLKELKDINKNKYLKNLKKNLIDIYNNDESFKLEKLKDLIQLTEENNIKTDYNLNLSNM